METPRPSGDARARAYEDAFVEAFEALASGDAGPLDRHFAREGLSPPRIVWEPRPDALPDDAILRATYAYWDRIRGRHLLPDWCDFHAEDLGVDIVHLAVVDPIPGTDDFRFAVYGSAVSDTSLRDYRGDTVREMTLRAGTPLPILYRVVYALARQRRSPAFTWSVAPAWQPVLAWNRLVLPFAHADDLRFLVCLRGEGKRDVPEDDLRAAAARLAKD